MVPWSQIGKKRCGVWFTVNYDSAHVLLGKQKSQFNGGLCLKNELIKLLTKLM